MSKLSIAGVFLTLGVFSAGANAEPAATDPGDLPDFFAGEWTLKGSEATFHERCRWLSPNSYLICEGEDTNPEAPAKWITMLGYSHAEDTYNFSSFYDDGGKFTYTGWLEGDVWNFVGENTIFNRTEGVEIIRRQEILTPTKDGYHVKATVSVDGAPWKVVLDEELIRVD